MDSRLVTALAAGGVFVTVFLVALFLMTWDGGTDASFAARDAADAYVASGGDPAAAPNLHARPLQGRIKGDFAKVAEGRAFTPPPNVSSDELGLLDTQPREIKVARFQARGMTYLCMVHGRGKEREMEVTRYDATHWQFDDGGERLFRSTGCTKAMIDHGAVMNFEAFEEERRLAIPDTAEYADLRAMFEATKVIRAQQNARGGH